MRRSRREMMRNWMCGKRANERVSESEKNENDDNTQSAHTQKKKAEIACSLNLNASPSMFVFENVLKIVWLPVVAQAIFRDTLLFQYA